MSIDEPAAMTLLRGALSKRATSAEFNEWQAREVVEYVDRLRSALIAPPAAGARAVPIPGLSAWEGWDRSRGDWSESHHKDDVLVALFRAPWSIEDAAELLGFIDRTWTRRPAPTAARPRGAAQ